MARLGPWHRVGSSLPPPPPPAQGPFPLSPPPLPLPPALSRAHRGAGALRPRSPTVRPAKGQERGPGPPEVGAPLAWLSGSRLLLARSPAFSGKQVRPKALGAAERAQLLGARKAANHAPRLPRPPPAAGSRARPSAASVERARQRRGGAAGPAAARGGQISPRVLGHPRWCEGETTSQCRFTTLFLPGAGESGVTNSLKKLFWTISAGVFSNTRRFPGLGSRS